MAFTDLSIDLQNILLVNHSYITKWFVFLVIMFLSAYYIWSIWPNHEQTNYITQAILRMFFYGLSCSFLLVSPLILLLMSPEYAFLNWYVLILKFFYIFTSMLMILIFVDFVKLGIFTMMGFAGLNLGDEGVNEIVNNIKNNKHFLKMNKKKGFKFGK